MDDDFDIPSNTEELDNALHEIHSEFIKAKQDESKANKEYLKEVMCVHVKFLGFHVTYCLSQNFIYLLIVFQNPYTRTGVCPMDVGRVKE
jgi:hypothetical protein